MRASRGPGVHAARSRPGSSLHQTKSTKIFSKKYLEKFRKSDKNRVTLLGKKGDYLRRDEEARNSILITWQISFDHMRHERQSAADLLSLMSFFDRQGIPESLLLDQKNNGNTEGKNVDDQDDSGDADSMSEASVEDVFEEDILTLRNYCFITLTTDTQTFEMHRLVQLATRKWLEQQGQLEQWRSVYIHRLSNVFPIGDYENWAECQVLFPHTKVAATQPPQSDETLIQWAGLLFRGAWYAWRRASISDARMMAEEALKVRKRLLGEEHTYTLFSMGMVASAYELEGRWKEAEQLELQALAGYKKVCGEEHVNNLHCMANLSLTYYNQNRVEEAQALNEQVLEIRKRTLGNEHLDTLYSMSNLGLQYRDQKLFKEAEEIILQVVDARIKLQGEDHPHVLTDFNNLGLTYYGQGRLEEAEEIERKVVRLKEKTLGEEHPDTLRTMHNLAFTIDAQGRHEEALLPMEKCVEVRERIIGPDHSDT